MKRRQSREMALQILFQAQFSPELKVDELSQRFASHLSLTQDVTQFSMDLVKGVTENKDILDQKINAASTHWKTSRMSLVDLNLLRLCLFEVLLYQHSEKLPVVLNETLELTKKYSSEDSVKFINGVVDKVWHEEQK